MLAALPPRIGAYVPLGLAVALSALLHALLLGGVSVRPHAGGEPVTLMLTARLERTETAQDAPSMQAVAEDQALSRADVSPAYRTSASASGALSDKTLRATASDEAPSVAREASDPSGAPRVLDEGRISPDIAPPAALQAAPEARSQGVAVLNAPEAANSNAGPAGPGLWSTTPTPAAPLAHFDPRPPMEVPVIVDSTVYQALELDDLPVSLSAIEPRFPESAARAGLSGSVTLEISIDEFGTVREARVADAVPAGQFEASALESLRAARFKPAQRDGRAVRCKLVIRVDFTPAKRPRAATR